MYYKSVTFTKYGNTSRILLPNFAHLALQFFDIKITIHRLSFVYKKCESLYKITFKNV
jgi:hypothetical protein